mgnify:CR=1 FL=1
MTQNPYGHERVRKGVGHYVTGRAIAAIASLIVVLLLVRVMPVQDYGVFVTATGAATILVMLSLCGLDRVILKFVPEGRLKASSYDLARFLLRMIGLRMAAAVAFLVPVIIAHEWLFGLLQLPVSSGILVAIALYALLFAFTDFSVYCLQALMLQEQLRLSVSVAWLVRLLVVGFILLAQWNLDAGLILWIWAAAESVAALILSIPLISVMRTGWQSRGVETACPKWPDPQAGLGALAASNFLSSLVGIPWQPYALRTIAGALLPVPQVAAYGFFQILIDRIRGYLPIFFFASLTEPLMSAHITKGEEKQRVLDNMAIVVQLSVWMLAPLIAVFAVVGQPAVELLTGGKYGEFSGILVILLCQILLGVHVSLLWSFFSVLGESRTIWRAVIPSVFVFPLLLYCGSRYGMFGMALTAPLNTIIFLLIMLAQLRRMGFVYPIHWSLLGRILLLSSLVPMPALGLLTIDSNWQTSRPMYLAMLALGGFAYLVGSYLIPPFSREQASVITRLMPSLAKYIK